MNPQPDPSRQWDAKALMDRVLELQDELLQAQEKNLMLSAQTRELERVARDAEDLKAELTAQGLLLADKTRENKHMHQEMSRVTQVLDVKLNEVEELRAAVADLQQQLKMRESERDLLAVMLNEAESAQRRAEEETQQQINATQSNTGWLRPFNKPKKP
jgi:HAMP domain-containing protein